MTGIVTHPTSGDRYCRTDVGGAYRWDAANNRWVQLLDWFNESENGFFGVEALALDPQNVAALLERGILRRLAGNNEGARSDWERIRQLAPNSPEAATAAANLKLLDQQGAASAPAQ